MMTPETTMTFVRNTGRRAFTMIELLVVLGIGLLVVALTAGAAVQIIAYQRGANTEATIRTLMHPLERQWKNVVDKAKTETIPSNVYAIASSPSTVFNDKRARVIWIKLRLKQTFPMNYSEALFPWALPPTFASAGPIQYYELPANQTYVNNLNNAGITGGSLSASVWPFESSRMLLMALQAGDMFNPDTLPPSAVMTDTAAPPLRYFVDAWQQPFVFYRFPAGNTDVDATNPAGSAAKVRDPLDPEGVLLDPLWNMAANYSHHLGVFWFEQYLHPIHTGLPSAGYSPASFYMVPVITSCGRNTRLGLSQAFDVNVPANTYPSPLMPDLMNPDGTGDNNDNLNSYRLRQGARGDS
jgi:prepilin-type N-terminal cleavage/methylation domain-containing protein